MGEQRIVVGHTWPRFERLASNLTEIDFTNGAVEQVFLGGC